MREPLKLSLPELAGDQNDQFYIAPIDRGSKSKKSPRPTRRLAISADSSQGSKSAESLARAQ
ncbi:MAG TPA: hypothetical protein EYQ22_06765 [Gammaproteobacteria bacterium]|nr:hypothetical protein [Gammaproteobacteria bacterium]